MVVAALRGHKVVRVACGATYSMAILESGEIYSWGSGSHPGHRDRLGKSHGITYLICLLVKKLNLLVIQ